MPADWVKGAIPIDKGDIIRRTLVAKSQNVARWHQRRWIGHRRAPARLVAQCIAFCHAVSGRLPISKSYSIGKSNPVRKSDSIGECNSVRKGDSISESNAVGECYAVRARPF